MNTNTRVYHLSLKEKKTRYVPVSNDTFQDFEKYVNTLNKRSFTNFIKNLFTTHVKYSEKTVLTKDQSDEYHKRCLFILVLEQMAMILNKLTIYEKSPGLIKIGLGKNKLKTYCVIDDSTVIDKDTGIIRNSNGSNEEPFRGILLFNSFSEENREILINTLFESIMPLKKILYRLKNGKNFLFDPIVMLNRIIKYCNIYQMKNVIQNLSWEINDSPYLLTHEERVKLFEDYDNIIEKWNSGYIVNSHGKLRMIILGVYFLDNIFQKTIDENNTGYFEKMGLEKGNVSPSILSSPKIADDIYDITEDCKKILENELIPRELFDDLIENKNKNKNKNEN